MTRRLIAVGVDRSAQSAAALDRAGALARPGRDVVHVVHAADLLQLEGCTWAPVRHVDDSRRAEAHRLVASAVAALRSQHPELDVDGSVVAGEPGPVLARFAQVVDLVLVGAPPVHPVEGEPVHRHVGRRLAARAACPVAVCPAEDKVPRDDLPVAVLLPGGGLPLRALELALGMATDRRSPLVVLVPWGWDAPQAPDPDEDLGLWEARRQREIDLELADLQRRHPRVGVSVELRRGDVRSLIELCHDTVGLLVMARESLGTHRADRVTPTALNRPPLPVVVVPAASAGPLGTPSGPSTRPGRWGNCSLPGEAVRT